MPSQNKENTSLYKHKELGPKLRSKLCDEEITLMVPKKNFFLAL